MVKNVPANAGDTSLIPGLGRSPGEGNGNPLQYFCLDNPMDRGAWRATVHGVKKSWIQLNSKTTQDGSHPTSKEQKNWFLAQSTPQVQIKADGWSLFHFQEVCSLLLPGAILGCGQHGTLAEAYLGFCNLLLGRKVNLWAPGLGSLSFLSL